MLIKNEFLNSTKNAVKSMFNREKALADKSETDLLSTVSKNEQVISSNVTLTDNEFSMTEFSEYEMSFNQKLMWLQYRMDANSFAYHGMFNSRVDGQLNLEKLQSAWLQVINLNSILRTTYHDEDGKLVQRVHSALPLPFLFIDRGLNEHKNKSIEILVKQQYEKPFKLTKEAATRLVIIKNANSDYSFLLINHHIMADAWTISLIVNQLEEFYANHIGLKKLDAKKLELIAESNNIPEYNQFIEYQNQLIQSQAGQQASDYWKNKLSGSLPILQLPIDKPRPKSRESFGFEHGIFIDRESLVELRRFAADKEVTPYTVLFTAFFILLNRITGQEDILIGTPVSGRTQAAQNSVLGNFVNTIVHRQFIDIDTQVSQLLSSINKEIRENSLHAEYPYTKIIDDVKPERSTAHTPIFQVLFNMAPIRKFKKLSRLFMPETENKPVEWADVNFRNDYYHQLLGQFDLTLDILEDKSRLYCAFKYSSSLFDKATIERMSKHYLNILSEIIANPKNCVSELDYLDDSEKSALIGRVDFNEVHNKTLHGAVEEFAATQPFSLAVSCYQNQLTYQEFNARANQLANFLLLSKIEKGDKVAICFERDIELCIAILAVLKCGAAYVPLDSSHPQARLAFIAEDAKIKCLLTDDASKITFVDSEIIIDISQSAEDINNLDTLNLKKDIRLSQLAYIIYTSGTTGKPKGVQVTHNNVARLFSSTRDKFSFSNNDVFSMFHSYAFDVSVFEMWGAWIHGAKLAVVPYWVSRDPEAFSNLIVDEQVTVLSQTPSAFYQLSNQYLQTVSDGSSPIKFIIFAGEALDVTKLIPWIEHFEQSQCKLINMYGTTETTVHASYKELSRKDCERGQSLIGDALGDLSFYLLDEKQKLVPVGVPGEIFISGPGVSLGYLNRPELNSERFIANPLIPCFSGRVYRTGDLARRTNDNDIEYLGRKDSQVQLKGFRIELGEIDFALSQHAAFSEAKTIMRKDSNGDFLASYCILTDGQVFPDNKSLRQHLNQFVPDYMFPSFFIEVEHYPLTVNGKLDVSALPEAKISRDQLASTLVEASTDVEETLVEIWREVLGQEKLGVDDNFFDLGGDSIRSVQVIAQAREQGIHFDLKDIFEQLTIANLAKIAVTSNDAHLYQELRPFELLSASDLELIDKLPGTSDAYPLSVLQAGMLFHSNYYPNSPTYHDIFGYRVKAIFDYEKVKQCAQQLARDNTALRTSFHLSGFSEPLAIVHQSVNIPVFVYDLTDKPAQEQDTIINAWMNMETRQSFELTQPPAVRIHVHQLSQDCFNLSLSFHHALIDGWSEAVLMLDFWRYYADLLGGKTLPLDNAPSLTFNEYIKVEKQALNNDESKQFWRSVVNGFSPSSLPKTKNKPNKVNAINIRYTQRFFNEEVSEKALSLANQYSLPLKNILLAVHTYVLAIITDSQDVTTGLACQGRLERQHGERVVGNFLNCLPFRVKFSQGSWVDLIQQCVDFEMSFIRHQRYPMQRIQEENGNQPLFETLFTLIHFHVSSGLQGLEHFNMLSRQFAQQTNFTMVTSFVQDPVSGGLTMLQLDYDADRLEQAQVEAYADLYTKVLNEVASNPLNNFTDYQIVDWEQHTNAINTTIKSKGKNQISLVDQLIKSVKKHTRKTAVITGDKKLSYRELWNAGCHLAEIFAQQGINKSARIACDLATGSEQLITHIALMLNGAIIIPLTHTDPIEKKLKVLKNTSASYIIYQQSMNDTWESSGWESESENTKNGAHESFESLQLKSQLYGINKIELRSEYFESSQSYRVRQRTKINADEICYVFNTSGSTGEAKGMQISQSSVASLYEVVNALKIDSNNDNILVYSNSAFDASLFETWTALSYGITLNYLNHSINDLAALKTSISKNKITLLWITSSLFEAFVDSDISIFKCLSKVIVGGDKVSSEHVRILQMKYPQLSLFNGYGPTESTTFTTLKLIPTLVPEQIHVPIGKATANRKVAVVNSFNQPCHEWCKGELMIAGDGLATSYLLDGKSLSLPLKQLNGIDYFASADQVLINANNDLLFFERTDGIRKIRGFRVELAEIEQAILSHPAVKRCTVLLDENSMLYAWFTSNSRLNSQEMRNYLSRIVSGYMIPQSIQQIDILPLTSHGKIDAKKLNQLVKNQKQSNLQLKVNPRNAIEVTLVNLLADLLQIDKVCIYDDYQKLGLNSIQIIRLAAFIKQNWKNEISIDRLFEYSSVAQLADFIHQATVETQSSSPLVKLMSSKNDDNIFFIHPVGGNVLCYRNLLSQFQEKHGAADFNAYGIASSINTQIDSSQAFQSIENMAAQYIRQMKTIQPQGPYRLFGWSMGGVIGFEIALQLKKMKESVNQLYLVDSYLLKPKQLDNTAVLNKLLSKEFSAMFAKPIIIDEQYNLLNDSAFIDKLDEIYSIKNSFPSDEVLTILRLYRCNFLALATYKPSMSFSAAILAKASMASYKDDDIYSWEDYLLSSQQHVIQGDHFSIIEDPRVVALLETETQTVDVQRKAQLEHQVYAE